MCSLGLLRELVPPGDPGSPRSPFPGIWIKAPRLPSQTPIPTIGRWGLSRSPRCSQDPQLCSLQTPRPHCRQRLPWGVWGIRNGGHGCQGVGEPGGLSAARQGAGAGTGTHPAVASPRFHSSGCHGGITDTPALLVTNGRFSFPASLRSPHGQQLFRGLFPLQAALLMVFKHP